MLDVVERYATAVDHRFFAVQCRLMTPAHRAAVIRRAVRLQRDPGARGVDIDRSRVPTTCVEAFEVAGNGSPIARVFQTDQNGAFDDLSRAQVAISGDRAVVTDLSVPALGTRVVLVQRGGDWLVDEPG